jgi:hypothetical protein
VRAEIRCEKLSQQPVARYVSLGVPREREPLRAIPFIDREMALECNPQLGQHVYIHAPDVHIVRAEHRVLWALGPG